MTGIMISDQNWIQIFTSYQLKVELTFKDLVLVESELEVHIKITVLLIRSGTI